MRLPCMYIQPDVNGTAERTFDLSLLTSSGAVIATCECTQEADNSMNFAIALTLDPSEER